MTNIDEYGEIKDYRRKTENYRNSQSQAELIAIREAERNSGCSEKRGILSYFWVTSSADRGEYYEFTLEGHPTCAEKINSEVIYKCRVMNDGSLERRRQQRGSWCVNSNCKEKGCIIITACYGEVSQEVKISRFFRNNFLASNFSGRLAIDGYYKISPYIVDKMKQFEILKKVVRAIIVNPIVVYEKAKIKRNFNLKKILLSFIYYPCIFFITIAGILSNTQKLIKSLFKVY
ncbi:MAG: CFI-box-CTERM domain-containing protein [Promethearchaeota archaeon]